MLRDDGGSCATDIHNGSLFSDADQDLHTTPYKREQKVDRPEIDVVKAASQCLEHAKICVDFRYCVVRREVFYSRVEIEIGY